MLRTRGRLIAALLIAGLSAGKVHAQPPLKDEPHRRNVIIFVADGLRHGSVNAIDSPRMFALRSKGVNFVNSHSLFPTFTTANASAFATGHQLGDTGDFSNTIYSGYPVFNTGNFESGPGSVTPFVENDQVLGDLDDHFSGNYLHEETLLSLARAQGYATAAIGKLGPVAIQDVTEIELQGKQFPTPATVIIDDSTGNFDKQGKPIGVPLAPAIAAALKAQGLGIAAPGRGSNSQRGPDGKSIATTANLVQQHYFADALTEAVLPVFQKNGQPFALVFWSRDPDGTQHNQEDRLDSLTPGINGPTSRAAVKNADNNLGQILDYLKLHDLEKNTDIFVVSDHGFSTISHHDLDASGASFVKDYASSQSYPDVHAGYQPVGFLAIDIAHELALPLFDPDHPPAYDGKTLRYSAIDAAKGQHPDQGNGLIGGAGTIADPAKNTTDAEIVIAANGGSDLIYLPTRLAARQPDRQEDNPKELVHRLVSFLIQQPYVSGLFVDDDFGDVAGALPLSSIGLAGSAVTPRPAIVVAFRTFATDAHDPVNSRVELADSTLQQGQGMHGSFSRGDTFNTMLAYGPDFKTAYTDSAPVSNADVAPTVAAMLGIKLPSKGKLRGRVIEEAMAKGADAGKVAPKLLRSRPEGGVRTVLKYQVLDGEHYYDVACFISGAAVLRLTEVCK